MARNPGADERHVMQDFKHRYRYGPVSRPQERNDPATRPGQLWNWSLKLILATGQQGRMSPLRPSPLNP